MHPSWWATLSKTGYIFSYLISIFVTGAFWLSYKSYNSPRLDLDTDFLRWTSRLPAVSVCQADGFNSTWLHSDNDAWREFIHGLVRPGKKFCTKCNEVSLLEAHESIKDFHELAFKTVESCQNLFRHCSFNGKTFDCCQKLGQLWTKKGICYSINSDMTQNNFKISVSHFARSASLQLTVNYPVQVFIHDPKDVLFLNPKAPVVEDGSLLSLLYQMRETVMDQSAWSLTLEQRGCVLRGEWDVRGYRTYSQSACKSRCLAEKQLAVCGCYHHLLHGIDHLKFCDFKGLQCLDFHFNNENKTKSKKYKHNKCNCLPTCEQHEVKIIWGKLIRNHSAIMLNIQLESPPTERLVLKSKVDFLDVLVGFACFTRLFTSFSFLDIAKTAIIWFYSRRDHPSYRQMLY